jgi:hypothetical protein
MINTKMLKDNMSLDKFYTSDENVLICYEAIKKNIKIDKKDLIVEPSAGDGAFIHSIKKLTNNYIFFDINPDHEEIKKQNFLKVKDISEAHIIGNPPFGNKSSLAIKFIKHCALLKSKTISFILPISFHKPSLKKSFPLNYHLIYEVVLPSNSFFHNKKIELVKTIFQIWERRDYIRHIPKKIYPFKWYSFVKNKNCNLTIKRVGFNLGIVKKYNKDDNINTNWFIKIHIPLTDKLLLKLNSIKYDKTKNVGAYSISKQDIISKYNKINTKLYED